PPDDDRIDPRPTRSAAVTDIDRIKQMVQDGRITPEEGDRLIAVLGDAKAADDELQVAGEAMEVEARAPLPPLDARTPEPPEAPRPVVPAAPAGQAPTSERSAAGSHAAQPAHETGSRAALAPADTRWVRVEML